MAGTAGGYGAEALINSLRESGDPQAADLMERRAAAAGAYPYVRRGKYDDYGLLADGTRSPAWTCVIPLP